MRLPPVTGPSIGIKVTADDSPFALFVTRPFVSDFTSGVFSQNPGSVGLPKLATVTPSDFAVAAGAAGAAASLRCAVLLCPTPLGSWLQLVVLALRSALDPQERPPHQPLLQPARMRPPEHQVQQRPRQLAQLVLLLPCRLAGPDQAGHRL